MKQKIFVLFTIVLFLISALNVFAGQIEENSSKNNQILNDKLFFSEPSENKKDVFSVLDFQSSEDVSYLSEPGKPELPFFSKTYKFPINTKIKDINIEISDVKKQTVSKTIKPSERPRPRIKIEKTLANEPLLKDSSVYSSSELYPSSWYDYRIGCGLDKNKRTIFVTVRVYPIRYNPLENIIYKISDVDIELSYAESKLFPSNENDYDMVIISPESFKDELQRLVDHKNWYEVKTFLKTTEEIYSEYGGRDKPEQIKYFIKDAIDNYNIKNVLLVGGLNSYWNADDRENRNYGEKDWWVPVRYTNIVYDSWDYGESGTISDLYYADVYKYNESEDLLEFEDWDENKNNIFAEGEASYGDFLNDPLDLYPDVHIGRLACRNIREVKTVVKKIINYEKSGILKPIWSNKMIAAGGKTFSFYEDMPDGEYTCEVALDYMGDSIEPVRLYASHNDTGGLRPIPRDIARTLSKGAGFGIFQGHSNPFIWDTHWADATNFSSLGSWTGGISIFHLPLVFNFRRLPILIMGGCHNGLFNVTIIKTLKDSQKPWTHWTYGVPTPSCLSWRLVSKPNGGAIATTGCTGFGLGLYDPVTLSSEIETNFFKMVGKENATTVGEAYTGSITEFLDDPSYGGSFGDGTEAYVITIYELFGDPSLKIGGYK